MEHSFRPSAAFVPATAVSRRTVKVSEAPGARLVDRPSVSVKPVGVPGPVVSFVVVPDCREHRQMAMDR